MKSIILYSEIKIGQQSVFEKHALEDDGKEIFRRRVRFPLFQQVNNGFTYFVLYNDDMEIISDFYEYLNFDISDSPITTRTKAAFSIRLLYCFLALANYNVCKITDSILKEYQFFLRGIGSINSQYSMKTQRSSNTINGYLATYRSFFSKRKIPCEPLFRAHTTFVENCIGNDYLARTERIKYSSNLKAQEYGEQSIPKYIGPGDFKTIYKIALYANDKLAIIILHLMYAYGLRLGEVLGLTLEDIKEIRIDGKFVPVLILRNRLSDKKFQYAKGCKHALDTKQYHTKDYTSSRQQVIITYDMYEQLIEYIETTHMTAMENYPQNYETGSADIVSIIDKPDNNHYVFLNRYGRILSDQTWNNLLKKYFAMAKIPIDTDVRENNLSHRFRHGFAMFHARFSEHPVNVLELQKLMRHKSISSTMLYYNPTPEDELKTKTEYQTELYKMIPELAKGFEHD